MTSVDTDGRQMERREAHAGNQSISQMLPHKWRQPRSEYISDNHPANSPSHKWHQENRMWRNNSFGLYWLQLCCYLEKKKEKQQQRAVNYLLCSASNYSRMRILELDFSLILNPFLNRVMLISVGPNFSLFGVVCSLSARWQWPDHLLPSGLGMGWARRFRAVRAQLTFAIKLSHAVAVCLSQSTRVGYALHRTSTFHFLSFMSIVSFSSSSSSFSF